MKLVKKVIYVPVGELRVTSDRKTELWTVTASCVALILTDTVHHVCGMLHVVLPGRRSDLRKEDRYAYFADTGAPMLINEMQKAGSEKNCLSAILVGGGSLFRWQEGGDIGRENVAALKTYLNNQEIPVIREETGGGKGRRVSLQTDSHQLLIEPLKYKRSPEMKSDTDSESCIPINTPMKLVGKSDEKSRSGVSLLPYIDELEKVKADNAMIEKLLAAIHSQEIDWQAVCVILSMEPILSHYFFRLVNSSYYGVSGFGAIGYGASGYNSSGTICTFSKARKLLTKPHFRRLCIVSSFAGNQEASPILSENIITGWKAHSLATAFIARYLAESIVPEYSEEAYVAGLFHALGDLCLALRQPYINRMTEENDTGSVDRYKTGGELTSELMWHWNYPALIINAVYTDLSDDFQHLKGAGFLPGIVHVACWISRLIGITSQVEPSDFVLNKKVMKSLGFSDSIHSILPPILRGLETLGLKQWIKK